MNPHDIHYIQLKERKLIEILNNEKTVVDVASELHVSRQIVHRWLMRYKRFGIDGLVQKKRVFHPVAHNKTSQEKEDIVLSVAKKYWQDGVETLHDRIQYEYNLDIHPVTIYRILKRKKLDIQTTMFKHKNDGRRNCMFTNQQVKNYK